MCVGGVNIYYMLSIKILILVTKWGQYSGPHNFKGLVEVEDVVLMLRLALVLGLRVSWDERG